MEGERRNVEIGVMAQATPLSRLGHHLVILISTI